MVSFGLLTLSLVASVTCDSLSPDAAVRAVQLSPVFAATLRAAQWSPDDSARVLPWLTARACRELSATRPRVLQGAAIVTFTAFFGIEDASALLGVRGRQVILLNKIEGNRLVNELDLDAWNRFVDRLPPLPDSLIPEYVRFVAYAATGGGLLGPCVGGCDVIQVSADSMQGRAFLYPLYRKLVTIGRDRRIIAIKTKAAPN